MKRQSDVRLLHGSSFGAAAAAYAEHRPDYERDTVRWALDPAPGRRVLDLGAGTGKLTGALIALGTDGVAGAEIARVLVPGGVLAALWKLFDDRIDWVAGLARVSGTAAIGPRDVPTGWRAETAALHLPWGVFDAPERAEFAHAPRRSADSLVATLATKAGVLVMPGQERDALLGRIRDHLASRPETAEGEFTLPMLTGVLRARRR